MSELNCKVTEFMNMLNRDESYSPILKIGINLDLEPEKRYQSLICQFDITQLKKEFQRLYNQYLPKFPGIEGIASFITFISQSKIKYYDEIEYWSKIFDMSFHQVVLMQLLYEINSGCTTYISTIEGKQVMVRTFDWPEPLLQKIIYHGEYYKNGKKIYEGISILGSVGMFTGKSSTQEYSLAINYRRLNCVTLSTIFNNFCNIMKSYWPVSYLLRHCLETEMDYNTTITSLKNACLVSPVYYSVNGFNQKPLIIQRGPTDFKDITGDYTIQTNCDNENLEQQLNIEYSIQRWIKVRDILEKEKDFNDIMISTLTYPIIREDTVYISIITDDKFETSVLKMD